jgi:hypothetical protein
MIELNPVQKQAKKYIEWLMSTEWNNKGTGKSYLMATIFLEQAIKKPGVWIPVWDHGSYYPGKEKRMLEYIVHLAKEHYPKLRIKINNSNYAFLVEECL